MRTRILVALAIVLAAAPAWAGFTLVQSGSGTTTTTTCTIAGLSAIGARDLLVVADDMFSFSGTSNSATDGTNTYSHCSNCNLGDSVALVRTDMWYVLSAASTAGSTTVTVTRSGSLGGFCYFAEYSYSGTAAAVDASGSADSTAALTHGGIALTLTGTNDAVVQGTVTGSGAATISSIASGGSASYTSPFLHPNTQRSAMAGALNTTDGSAPTWTLSGSARSVTAAMAFSETGGGGTTARVRHRSEMY